MVTPESRLYFYAACLTHIIYSLEIYLRWYLFCPELFLMKTVENIEMTKAAFARRWELFISNPKVGLIERPERNA